MQKPILFFILIAITLSFKQTDEKVHWAFSKRIVKNKTELVLTATIEDGWHIYSQYLKGDGPVPTSITFNLPKGLSLKGKTLEPKPIEYYDENFRMNVKYFDKKVEFIQPISGKLAKGNVIKGTVTYMVCNNQMCYPPVDVNFEIKL